MAMDFPNSPTVNQTFTVGDKTWKWTGTVWEIVVNRPAMRSVADTPPASPMVGDEWFNSLTGRTYTWFDSYWIEVNTNNVVGASGLNGVASASAPLSYNSTNNNISVQSDPTFSGTTTSTGSGTSAAAIVANAGRLRVVGGASDTSGVLELQSYDGIKNYVYKSNGGGLNFTTSAGLAMTVNANGNVTKPYQPSCLIDGIAGWNTIAAGNYITGAYWGLSWQRGGFSWNGTTGALTVPVTGHYSVTIRRYRAGNTSGREYIRKNGADVGFFQFATASISDTQYCDTQVFQANANDYFQVYISGAGNAYYGSQHTQLFVQFLG